MRRKCYSTGECTRECAVSKDVFGVIYRKARSFRIRVYAVWCICVMVENDDVEYVGRLKLYCTNLTNFKETS